MAQRSALYMMHGNGETQTEERQMNRYAIRLETADGTLEDAAFTMSRKADAIRSARNWSKTCACADVVRVHVDDTRTDIGIAAFEVAR
jgi:hypothetical protein